MCKLDAIIATCDVNKDLKISKIVGFLKPGIEPERVESYRTITISSGCFILLLRLIYKKISPAIIIDTSTPIKQASLRSYWNYCDPVLVFTKIIRNGFEYAKKISTEFPDISAARDTV